MAAKRMPILSGATRTQQAARQSGGEFHTGSRLIPVCGGLSNDCPFVGRRIPRSVLVTLTLCLGVTAGWAAAADSSPGMLLPGLVLKDFVWPEYHPPPHEKQLRFRLQAAEAEPGEGAWVRAREVVAERFTTDGGVEFQVRAPRCEFHTATQEARSDGPLEVRLQSDRLVLEGRGFLWRQTNACLVVSNQVRTLLRGGWLAEKVTPLATNARPLRLPGVAENEVRIESDRFLFEGATGRVEFSGRVRATGRHGDLRCDRLRFVLAGGATGRVDRVEATGGVTLERQDLLASAERAVYLPARDRVELEGDVRWRKADANGRADRLGWDLRQETLQARGNTVLHWIRPAGGLVPGQSLLSGHETGPVQLTISAGTCDLSPRLARFEGGVEVVESPSNGPEARLLCAVLVVRTDAAGSLESVEATGGVDFEREELHVTGSACTYQARLNRVEVAGPVEWEEGLRSGAGDRLWMEPDRQRFGIEGNAELVWPRPPGRVLLAGAGNPPGAPAPSPGAVTGSAEEDPAEPVWTRVRSGSYVWSGAQLEFTGGVEVEDPELELTCERLRIQPPPEDQGEPDLWADGGVIIRLAGPPDSRITATAQRMEYDAAAARLRLTGQPVVERGDDSRFTADEIVYHRRTGVISTVGTYRARVERPAGTGTNGLPALPWPR